MNKNKLLNSLQKGYSAFFRNSLTFAVIEHLLLPKGISNSREIRIWSALKEHIYFSVFDLLDEKHSSPPSRIFGNFDLVICANLLFYYKPQYREKIINKVENSMAEDAYLIVGETEREILNGNRFREVYSHSAIFKKI